MAENQALRGEGMRKALLFQLSLVVLAIVLACGTAYSQENSWTELKSRALRLYRENKLDDAIKVARQALEVAEKTFGPEHLNTAVSLGYLADLYHSEGRYNDAEPLYVRALVIRKKASGPEAPDTVSCMNDLAVNYRRQGRYNDAEPILKKTLELREKACGPNHPDVALSLNNLAGVYRLQGRYSDAEALYRRALKIDEKELGPEDPETAWDMSNLAGVYQEQGRYSEAETLFRKALEIIEKASGPNHNDTARILNNLAGVYQLQGRNSDAAPLLERALEIRKKVLGPNHPGTATIMSNLAELYYYQEDRSKAINLAKAALDIREKTLGPEHPFVARTLNLLAFIYIYQGRYSEAESLLQKALAIQEKTLGREHPVIATSLNGLAVLYMKQGLYGKAEPLLRQALTIQEKALGQNNPDLTIILNNLASLLAVSDRPADALHLMQRALSIDDHTISDVFTLATEREKFAFLATVQGHYEWFINLVVQKLNDSPEALTAGLNGVLRRKGIVLDALSRERSTIMESEKPEVKALYRKLQTLTSLISSLSMAGPGKASMEEYRSRLNALESERESLEKEITASSGAYALQKRTRTADCTAVAEKLPTGSALVEYLCIPMLDFKATGTQGRWRENRYFAFMLTSSQGPAGSTSGCAGSPQLVDLGEASVIDEAVKEFRAEMMRARTLWESQILNESEAEKRLAEKGRHLYDLVILPIRKAIGERTTLFLAPDADLNLIPFGALQDETGRYLVEKYCLYYLSCGRDLLRFGEKAENNGESVIVANPDFNMKASEQEVAAGERPGRDDASAMRGITRSADLTVSTWSPLPGTKTEAEVIAKTLQGERIHEYEGRSALEEMLKRLHSPRRIHIATHGFFLEDQVEPSMHGSDMQMPHSGVTGELQAGTSVTIENPLLRAGIVLAGANRLGRQQIPEGRDDGVLTALEISGIPLRGTELVVLSACDTGLGEVHSGEGVFGLRRAFQLAGVRTLVMSLWSVPDVETQELMKNFYGRLKKGDTKASALREACLAMIKERREKYGEAHPFFWAPFICVGEP